MSTETVTADANILDRMLAKRRERKDFKQTVREMNARLDSVENELKNHQNSDPGDMPAARGNGEEPYLAGIMHFLQSHAPKV
jgi:hypothetical protein